jgi:hypothetical protein
MNNPEREMIERLNAMPLEQARCEIASGLFGDVGSPNHEFCSSWLYAKESAAREEREKESLSISRKALSSSVESNSLARNALDTSRLATRIAISAIVLSTIMAIHTLIEYFSK